MLLKLRTPRFDKAVFILIGTWRLLPDDPVVKPKNRAVLLESFGVVPMGSSFAFMSSLLMTGIMSGGKSFPSSSVGTSWLEYHHDNFCENLIWNKNSSSASNTVTYYKKKKSCMCI